MPKGRVTGKMIAVQKWWDEENLEGNLRDRDARYVVAKVIGLVMLVRYEIWKVRCVEVAMVSLPAKQQVQWNLIMWLRTSPEEVEARDRCLFEEEHIPKDSDSLQKMEDWVLAVTMVTKRARERSLKCVNRLNEETMGS